MLNELLPFGRGTSASYNPSSYHWLYCADLATARERQLTTALANQTTGLTNGRTTNWAPEVDDGSRRSRSVAKSAYLAVTRFLRRQLFCF